MSALSPKMGKPSPLAIIGAIVFFLALGLRLVGLGWGLKNDYHNASYHPDEPVIFGFSRAIQPFRGQFVPQDKMSSFYSYGTLYLSLLRVASDITTTYGGAPKTPGEGWSSQPGKTDWDWASRCTLAGRFLSCIAGAAATLLVFLLLADAFGLISGVAAAVLMGVAPAFLVHSRFQTVDVLATCLLTASLLVSCRIASRRPGEEQDSKAGERWLLKAAIWSGVFAGLSAGTKYTGILALASLLLALYLSGSKKWLPLFGLGLGVGLAAFAVSTPGSFLDTANFLDDVKFEMVHTSTGHGLVSWALHQAFVYTLINLMFGIGPILLLMGGAGILYAAYRKHRWAWVILAFSIPYYLLIGRAEVKFVRYSFPLYVAVACGFGYVVQAAHRRGGLSRAWVGLGILGIGGVPFGGVAGAALLTKSMLDEDPRDAAAKYLAEKPGKLGLVDSPWFWSPATFKDAADPPSVPYQFKLGVADSDSPPADRGSPDPGWNSVLEYGSH